MKRHLDLVGKSLAGAGLTGIVLYVVGTATQRSWPLWPYLIFIGMLLLSGLLYLIGQRSDQPKTTEAETTDEVQQTQSALAFTDRWRHTSNGAEAPGLMRTPHYGFSHPGYVIPPSEDKPPFVRIGALATCDPLDATPTTSDLRDRFLAFLGRPPMSALITELTYVGNDFSWRSYAGNGRIGCVPESPHARPWPHRDRRRRRGRRMELPLSFRALAGRVSKTLGSGAPYST